MNRIFRLVWNDTLQAWVAVSEKARSRGKRSARALALVAPVMAATLGMLPPAQAGPPLPNDLPTNGKVTAGAAVIVPGSTPGAAVLDINQTSQRATINWETFNVGSAAQVNFHQPDANASTLNRVLDTNASQIMGKITANGQVFLSNPNGVYFGKTASVDVGGLTATTHAISDADFMAGKLNFSRNGATGSVVNEGTLRAALGGYIALLAPEVRNEGVIVAQMGTVAMAAGDAITLNFNGASLAGITVQPSAIRALVENKGAVLAPGGLIVLSARALDRLQGGVVKNSGRLEATGLAMKNGRIVLEASDRIENTGVIAANAGADGSPAGTVTLTAPVIVNSGAISATAPLAAGGSVALAGDSITQTAGATVDVSGATGGTVTVKATADVALAGTVAATGAEQHGGSVTIAAAHDVTAQDAVIDVSGAGAGGEIAINGGSPAPLAPDDHPTVALLGATQLRSSSRRGQGGAISLTADRVGLFDTTFIDATGATGGGAVRVGGGFHGADATLANAAQVIVGANAVIDTSAVDHGDAGNVTVWSDRQTTFAGQIAARGGAQGGAGGFVEVSGKAGLAFDGKVDAGASHGAGGTLLLDPQNIVIQASGAALASGTLGFSDNAGNTSTITPDSIAAIANATGSANGTAVVLQATDDITINSTLVTNASANYAAGALTFQAGRSIAVNAGVISGNGALNFIINDQNAMGVRSSGAASFNSTGTIDAGSANINVLVGTNSGGVGAITTGRMTGNNIVINTNNVATGGTLELGGMTVQNNLTVNSGGQNISNAGASAVLTVGNTALFNATLGSVNGDVTINPYELTSSIGTFSAFGHNISYTNSGPFQMGRTGATGNLVIKSLRGAIGSVDAIQVGGATTVTTTSGGFGYSVADLDWTNNGNVFTGLLTITSGSHADIHASGAILLGKVSVPNGYFNLLAGVSADGSITTTDTINVGSNVGMTAGLGHPGDLAFGAAMTAGSAVDVYAGGNVTVNAGISTAGSLNVVAGQGGTGSITGAGALTTNSTLTLTARGTANAGRIALSGIVTAAAQDVVDAGAGNDITIDNALNNFGAIRVTGNNVTLVDRNGIQFGANNNAGGYTSSIGGNFNVTAGGDISQTGYADNNGYSAITVGGNTVFTLTAAGSLLLGQTTNNYSVGYSGQQNDFAGAVTLAKTGAGSYYNVYLRNNSAAAGVINGLAGSALNSLLLNYNNAPSLVLPGFSAAADVLVSVPLGSITQGGLTQAADAIVVGGLAQFQASNSKNIVLSNPNNDFTNFTVRSAYDVAVADKNAINIYSASYNDFYATHDLTVVASGNIDDGNGDHPIRVDGTATLTAGTGNITLDRQDNFWNGLAVPQANNVAIYGGSNVTGRNWTLGNFNVAGDLLLQSYGANAGGWNTTLTQLPGTHVHASPTGTTTLNYFANINLTESGNILGNLAMVTNWAGAGITRIKEDDAITQASNWGQNGGQSVFLTTERNQAITLNQTGNDITNLTITQLDPTAQTAGAVLVNNGNDLSQPNTAGGAWSTHGATTINTQGHQLILQNPLNQFAPLQVLGGGTTYVYAAQNAATGAAIADFSGGAWSTGYTDLRGYDSTGTTMGAGDVKLLQTANAIGQMTVWGNTVTITTGAANGIQDWNPWKTTGVTTLDSNGYAINLIYTGSQDVLGPLAIVGTSAGLHPSSVNIAENDAITQASPWTIGTAPVSLSSRTNAIDLSMSGNVLGALTIGTSYGVPGSVKITENDAITQGALWNLPAASIKLVAENDNAVAFGGYDNVLGNVAITGGAVNLRENGNIVQDGTADGAWHTAGVTTLAVSQGHDFNYRVGLDNAANTLGALAVLGTADGYSYLGSVTLASGTGIRQAARWNLTGQNGGVTFYSPVTIDVGTAHDVTLDQAGNMLGKLTVTARNATVVENKTIEDAGAGGAGWRVAGLTTLTAQDAGNNATKYNIDMVGADNDFGAVQVLDGANVKLTDRNAIVIAGAAVDPVAGLLTVTAGGAITQSAAITGNGILLSGTGYATLTGPGNMVDNVAANFTGGDLHYTGAADFAVSASTGISIGARKVILTSTGGAISQLLRVSGSSAGLDIDTFAPLTVPNTVSIAGEQTYTSAGGITLSGTMTSSAAGAITFNSPVTLGGAMQINNTSTSTNSGVVFNGTVDGAGYTLGVKTPGAVDFMQAVSDIGAAGTTTLLLQGAGTTTFHSTLQTNDGVSVAGALVLQDSATFGHGAQASIFGGLVTLGKAGGMDISGYNNLSFNGGLQLQAGPSTITSHDSTITLAGAVSGPYGLTLDAGQQNIIGISNIAPDITSLNATAGTMLIPGSFSIAGAQTYNANLVTLGGTIASTAPGAITFNSPVTLSAASHVNTVDSNVVFGDIVNGSFNLGVNAGAGTVTFDQAVGHINKLGSGAGAALVLGGSGATTFLGTLETNSGISAVGATAFDANVTLGNGNTGTTLGGVATLGGNTFSGYDGLAFNGGAALTGAATVLSNGSTLGFGNTVSGAYALTLNALLGTSGDVTGLQWLAPELTGLSVTAYTLNLPVAGFAVSGPMNFTATGGITLNGNVGNTTGTGQIDFNSPVTLATGAVTIATHDAPVNFHDTVTGPQNLTVDAGAGAITFTRALTNIGNGSGAALTLAGSGGTTFGASLAANSGLLATGGGNLFFQNDAAFGNGDTGSDFGTGTLSLGRAGVTTHLSGYDGFIFRGAVQLAGGPVAIDSHGGNIEVLGTIDGGVNLSVDAGAGVTQFAQAAGATAALGNGTGVALNLLSTGATSFASTLATASGISAVGPVSFDGNVTVGNGSVGSTFAGGVTLGQLTFSARNGIAFGGAVALAGGPSTINSNSSAIVFQSTIDGPQALTVNAGNSTAGFDGAIHVAALDVSANGIALPQVTTTGSQSYAAGTNGSGTIDLHGNLTTGTGNLNVSGGTTLFQNTLIATGGAVTFNTARSTIDGAFDLGIDAGAGGDIVLGGQLGQSAPLNNVTVAGNNLSLPNIAATGTQEYSAQHNITLVQSRTAGNDVSLAAGLAGDGVGALILPTGISLNVTNHALTISAADLQMNGTSSISTGSGLLTIASVTGNDIYLGGSPAAQPGQMAISGDELNRIATSGGLVLATSGAGKITVDGISAAQSQNVSGTLQLQAQGTGAITFQGAASTFNALTTHAASGLTNIAVNLSTTNDAIDFMSRVAVAGASTINSGGGDITFESTVAVDNDLTIGTGNGVLSFLGAVGSNKTLTLNLGGGRVDGLGQLQSALTGLTVNSTSGIALPAFAINGAQVYNTGVITATGNLGGVGISFNNVVDVAPASGSTLVINAGAGTLNFGNLASFNANAMTLTGDEINFARAVTGTGSLVLQPSTLSRNVAVNGGTAINGLNLTSADMGWLPIGTLTSLTIGRADGTGSLDLAGALNFGGRPLTLNGGGGITQSGALTSGDLALYAAGAPIVLTNAGNAFGAVAFAGTPSAASLVNTRDIIQQSAWNLGSASLNLDAGSHDITLLDTGNNFGTLRLRGHAVNIREDAATDFGASTVDSLAVVSAGAISTSGKLAVAGLADFKTVNTAGIVLDDASTFGAVKAVTGSGNIVLAPGASTLITQLDTTGNVTLNAGAGSTISEDSASILHANGLELLGAGSHALALGSNAITTLAGNTGAATLAENSGFDIGAVNASNGLSVGGTLTLSSTGSVTQSQALAAAGLELLGAGGSYTLDHAANALGTVAANTGTVSLTGNSGFAIGTVNTAGLATSGALALHSTGNVTQSAAIAAGTLALGGIGGNFALADGANRFTNVAATTGTLGLANDAGFVLDAVHLSGALSLASSGNVTQSQAISASGLELLGANGNYVLANDANVLPVLAGSTGSATVHTAGALSIAGMATSAGLQLAAGGAITQTGALAIGGDLALQTTHNAGDVAITNAHDTTLGATLVGGAYTLAATGHDVSQLANTDVRVRGDLTIDANSLVMGGAGNLFGGVNATPGVSELRASGVITLGDISQAGNYSVVSIASDKTWGGAAIHGAAITLNNAGNSIGGAIAVTTAAPAVLLGGEVKTGITQAAGTHIDIAGIASFTAEASAVADSGKITLDNAGNSFGSLVLSGSDIRVTESTGATTIRSAAASGSLVLNSAGAVDQLGTIVTPQLAVTANGAVTLQNAGNDVAQLAVHAVGAVAYRDANSVDIAGIETGAGAAVSLAAGGDITQSQAIHDATTLTASAGGSVALANAGNTIGALGAITAGSGIDINDATAGLTIGASLASAGGAVQVHTEGGDLVLADGSTIATGGAGNVVLAAGAGFNFKNNWVNTVANPITVGSGRYLIYSTNNADTVLGGIAANGYMGYTYAQNAPGSILGTDSRVLYNDIATLVFTANSQTRLYGDANPVLTYTVTGFLSGDTAASVFGGMPALATLLTQDSHVGSGAITISANNLSSLKGYAFAFVDGALTITARPVSLNGTRVYDGSTAVDSGTFMVANTYNGQTLTLSGSGVAASKDAANGTLVGLGTLALGSGTGLASDYVLAGATVEIGRKTVALSAARTYDGTVDLAGAVSVATGVAGESLTYANATGSDANVATGGKFIDAITLADGSGLAGNYQLPTLDAAHAALAIMPKTVALSATKTYDGSTALAGKVTIDTGIGGQALGYSGAVASDAHVASSGKYISAITLQDGQGGVASNYQLPALTGAGMANTVTIDAAILGATIANTGVTKVYDGSAAALDFTANYSYTGFVSGDTGATLSALGAAYDSAHVAAASKITVSGLAVAGITGSAGSLASDYVLDASSKDVAATIGARTLTASLADTGVTKTYDGTVAAGGFVPTWTLAGLASGDTGATITSTGAAYNAAHVLGATSVTVSGMAIGAIAGADGSLASDYVLDAASKSVAAQITARTVSLSANKVYDGGVSLAGAVSLATGVSGETLNYTGATASDANVATNGKYISAITLVDGSGALASDYAAPALASVTITPKTVVLSATKTYDGSTALAGAVTISTGIDGQALGYAGASASDAHVATSGKYINAITLQDGAGGIASNYQLPDLLGASAANTVIIDAAMLGATLTNTGVTKVYDGTTAPVGLAATYSFTGLVAGDTGATLASTGAAYDSAHVAAASEVTVSGLSIAGVSGSAGSQASDYRLASTSASVAASIGARSLVATLDNSGVTKVYDGSANAPGFNASFSVAGLIAGDTGASLSSTGAAYDSAHVAAATRVTVSGLAIDAISGSGTSLASDYVLDASSKSVAATVTARTLSATITDTGVTKTYDGSTAATGFVPTYAVTGFASGDSGATIDSTGAAYNSAHVAGANSVTVSGLSVGAIAGADGSQASDYVLDATSKSVAATIGARTVSLSGSKVYDSTLALAGAVTLASGVAGETLGYSGAVASDANVATSGKYISAITLADGSNALASDYRLPTLDAANAGVTITPKAVALSATKTYDGTTGLDGAVTIGTGIGGQALTYSGAIASDANVATAGKTISAITLEDGTGLASNYMLPALSGAAVTITPYSVNLSALRAYNGSMLLDASAFSVATIAGQTLTLTGAGAVADQHAGSNKAVALGTLALHDGSGMASNYTLAGGVDTATIGKAVLTVTASVASRTYDGSTGATLNGLAVQGLVSGETVQAVSAGSSTFADKNAAGNKTVTVTGIGLLDGANGLASDYTVAASTTALASIAKADLNVAGVVAADKVYDGTLAATINTSGAVLAGKFGQDDVGVGAISGSFADKNAGANKAVSVSAFVLSGQDAGNYNLVQPAGLLASITPRSLAVGATGVGKVYDASTAAAVTLTDNRIAGDVFDVSASAAFLDKNAGVNKFVNVGAITLSGADAANYSANSAAATFATVSRATLLVNATAQSKVYDGGTAATVAVSDNRYDGDSLHVSYGTAAFSDKNAGVGKTVTLGGIALTGADAANYNVSASATATANIDKATLNVSATGQSKTYDGGMAASVALGDNRVAGDSLVLGATATFGDAATGKAKPVSVSAIRITGGADSGNYVLANTVASAVADINVISDTFVLPSLPPVVVAPPVPPMLPAAPLTLAPSLPQAGLPGAAGWLDLRLPDGFGEAIDSDTVPVPGKAALTSL